MTEDRERAGLGRITLQGVADLLGVKPDTARRYARETYAKGNPRAQSPFFPRPNKDGLYSTAEVKAWAEKRKGLGGGKGAPKPKKLYQCEAEGCEERLPRRWVDPVTKAKLCKPHHRAGGEPEGSSLV